MTAKRKISLLTLSALFWTFISPAAGIEEEKLEKGNIHEFSYSNSDYLTEHILNSHRVYEEDFNSPNSSWILQGCWQVGTSDVKISSLSRTPGLVGTNLNGSYSDNSQEVLTSPSIKLPLVENNSVIQLSYREWFEIESYYDKARLLIKTDEMDDWNELRVVSGKSDWHLMSVDISEYSGKDVRLSFQLITDDQHHFAGWYIDDFTIDVLQLDPLMATMTSLNHHNFPFIYMNVVVDYEGEGFPGLTQSNFRVYENKVLQTEYFEVTPPSAGGGARLADIVFLMDNSGSMGEEISAISNHVRDFVNNLSTSGVDFALGLCRYGASQNSGNPIIEDNGILTKDADYFKNDVWERNVITGGYEPGYLAITQSSANFSFRPGAQKVFIIITDERPNQGGSTVDETIATCVNNSITLFALTQSNLFSYFTPITDVVHGACFNIYSNFDDILQNISSIVSNTYLIRYRSSDPAFNGVKRNVDVIVKHNGEEATASGSYIPGSAPVVRRTQNTIDLHNQAWSDNTTFLIEVEITDIISPYVNRATLYFKNTLDRNYSSLSMTNISGNIWQGSIDARYVNSPGLDYYITATDGENTASDPSVDPITNPYQLAILPNRAPQIMHTPPTALTVGAPLTVSAQISDNTNSLVGAKLYYHRTGQLSYVQVDMINKTGDQFEGVIPPDYVTGDGVEYYIRAWDDFGLSSYYGTNDNPIMLHSSNPVIAGRVTTTSGGGLDGVIMTFSGGLGTVVTSGSGYYNKTVPYGWSGTVTPSFANCTFSPQNRSYSNTTTDLTNQNYSTTVPTNPVISGQVTTSSGAGLDGVTLSFSAGGGTAVTGDGGYYNKTMPYGWSGTVTPSYREYRFEPRSLSYANLTTNQPFQNYAAIAPIVPVISGQVTTSSGSGLNGVILNFSGGEGTATTSDGGYYRKTVTYDWSGTVTPSYGPFSFLPPQRSYSHVLTDKPSQNYTATPPATVKISGRVTTRSGSGLDGVTLSFSGGEGTATTAGGGYYSKTVSYNWSGTVTPNFGAHSFTPPNRSYIGLTNDQPNQNYTATPPTKPVISGRVTTASGSGLDRVNMSFSGGAGAVLTNDGGYYSKTVSYGWSGTVTPGFAKYSFTPANRSYTDLTTNQSNQNYTAEPPVVNAMFICDKTTGQTPLAVSFTDQSMGDIENWHWDFGDGGTSTERNPIYTYNTPGIYTVSLTVSGSDVSDTETKDDLITAVDPKNSPDLIITVAAVNNKEKRKIEYTVTVRNDGTAPAVSGIEYQGLLSNDKIYANENDKPSCSRSIRERMEPGETATGTSSCGFSENIDYTYYRYLIVKVYINNPEIPEFNQENNYYVIDISDEGVTAAFSSDKTIGPIPLTVSFSERSQGEIQSWNWNFGDGGTSTERNPIYTYNTPGTYTVSLTVTGLGIGDTETKENLITVVDPKNSPDLIITDVTVNDKEEQKINYTVTVKNNGPRPAVGDIFCQGVLSNDLTYANENDQSACSTKVSERLEPGETASSVFNCTPPEKIDYTYHRYLIAKVYFGDPNAPESNYENNYFVIEIGNEGVVAIFSCDKKNGLVPLTVSFKDQSCGTVQSWSWDFGDGGSSKERHPTYTYRQAGIYTVSLHVTGPEGSDTETKPDYVNVNALKIEMTISRSSIPFGLVIVGQSKEETLVIGNASSSEGPLAGNITENSDQYSIISGGGSYSLNPGESRTVRVRFSPTAVGAHTADLEISHNATDQSSPINVEMSGSGGSIEITTSRSSIPFGMVALGESREESLVISNAASSAAALTGNITENSDQYSITSGGGSFSLNPGESRTVRILFSPASEGTHIAILEISHNATNQDSPINIEMSGSAATPTSVISGRVTSIAGTGIEDAEVVLYRDDSMVSTTLTKNGTYQFTDITAGHYKIRAGKNGYISLTRIKIIITDPSQVQIDFELTPETHIYDSNPNSIFLLNWNRFFQLYQHNDDNSDNLLDIGQVMSSLHRLLAHPEIRGKLVLVDLVANFPSSGDQQSWIEVKDANDVALKIHNLIHTDINYGITRYIVIIGSDEIIPFYRTEDLDGASFAENEYVGDGDYAHLGDVRNPISQSFANGRILTDSFYADKQREAPFIPELSISRLVETPHEIATQIIAYLSHATNIIPLQKSRVGGSATGGTTDGCSPAISQIHGNIAPIVPDAVEYKGTSWTKNEAGAVLNDDTKGILFYFGHGSHVHYTFGDGSTLQSPEIGTNGLSIIFAGHSHGGVNLPNAFFTGEKDESHESDMAAAFSGSGVASYIGLTGFGGGPLFFAAHTDKIAVLFSEYLAAGHSIGESMVLAKRRYYSDLLIKTPTDIKAMLVMVQYGLPFYQIFEKSLDLAGSLSSLKSEVRTSPLNNGATRIVIKLPEFTWRDIGDNIVYMNDEDINIADAGRPVLPGMIAHTVEFPNIKLSGADLVDAKFEYVSLDKPYFILGDIVYFDESRTLEFNDPNWYPSQLYSLNKIEAVDSVEVTAVVCAAQYLSTRNRLRICKELVFDLYLSDATVVDNHGPEFTSPNAEINNDDYIYCTVDVSDHSKIERVETIYSLDNGLSWSNLRMSKLPDSDTFLGILDCPTSKSLAYQFQGFDEYNNSNIFSNLGSYFVLDLPGSTSPLIDIIPFQSFIEYDYLILKAKIADADQDLDSTKVYFHYRSSGDDQWFAENLSCTDSEWYLHFDTNALSVGDTLYFYFSAEDLAGNLVHNPASNYLKNAYFAIQTGATDVKSVSDNLPHDYTMHQNYPNPFNPETLIQFDLPGDGFVKLEIFNILGQPVRILADSHYAAGSHTIIWDARNDYGQGVPSGVYFYRITAGAFRDIKKMLLLR